MARKPTLSPSKITTFLACPVRYRWTYADARGRWYMRAKSYYSFGNTLHKVLEQFHSSDDGGVQTVEQTLAAYDESWIDAGFSSAEEMAEAYGEGKEILERHVERALVEKSDAKTLYVEKLFRLDMGNFDLIGRIDRVDEHADGTLEIIDYKSGRDTVTEEQVASDIAMSCYSLLLKNQFPERKVQASILALRSGEKATACFTEPDLTLFQQDLKLLGDEILTTEFLELAPRQKPLCVGCDFIQLCRQHEDY